MSWRQLLWISNLLSLCRIVLVWPLAYALAEPSIIGTVSAVGILVVAGVTDFLDGYLARKFNQVTPLGAALDPITGLTIATTRQHMLQAMLDSLSQASAARLELFRKAGVKLDRSILAAGNLQGGVGRLMRRKWRGSWRVRAEENANLRGLSRLL